MSSNVDDVDDAEKKDMQKLEAMSSELSKLGHQARLGTLDVDPNDLQVAEDKLDKAVSVLQYNISADEFSDLNGFDV